VSKAKYKKAQKPKQEAAVPSSYEVEMTASAEATYKELYRRSKEAELRGDYGSVHCSTFNMVRDAVRRIIPADPLSRKHALRGELSNIFRLKKGRLRICWIASSKIRKVCVLFISETLRKDGDVNDPYVIFQNMVNAGTFDSLFQQFAVRMPRSRPQ